MSSVPPSDAPDEVQQHPDFDSALRQGRVTFPQVATAYFGQLKRHEPSDENRLSYEHYFPRLHNCYVDQNGGVLHLIWGEEAAVGAIRTGNGIIKHAVLSAAFDDPAEEAALGRMLDRCDELNERARRELAASEALAFQDRIWAFYTTAVTIADRRGRRASAHEMERGFDKGVTHLDRELGVLIEQSHTRRYLLGVLLGSATVLPVLVGIVLLGVLALRIPDFSIAVPCAAAFAGGVGASISVLSRVTFGSFTSPTGTRQSMMIAGTVRPAVGVIFGLALYSLVEGGILPLEVPDETASRLFFFAALGFLAGFSERFAEDHLGAAARRLRRHASRNDPTDDPKPEAEEP